MPQTLSIFIHFLLSLVHDDASQISPLYPLRKSHQTLCPISSTFYVCWSVGVMGPLVTASSTILFYLILLSLIRLSWNERNPLLLEQHWLTPFWIHIATFWIGASCGGIVSLWRIIERFPYFRYCTKIPIQPLDLLYGSLSIFFCTLRWNQPLPFGPLSL